MKFTFLCFLVCSQTQLHFFVNLKIAVSFVSRTFSVVYDSFPLSWEFVVERCRSGLTKIRSGQLREGKV
jgi:hypothetical protein